MVKTLISRLFDFLSHRNSLLLAPLPHHPQLEETAATARAEAAAQQAAMEQHAEDLKAHFAHEQASRAELQRVVELLNAEQEAKENKLSAATEAMAEAQARLDAATADTAELENALTGMRTRAEASDELRQAAAKSGVYKVL